MKKKYITTQILLACLSKAPGIKKDIHSQLEETIAERNRVIQQWERSFKSKPPGIKKDIHSQLAETIAEHKKIMRQWDGFFSPEQDRSFEKQDKKAA